MIDSLIPKFVIEPSNGTAQILIHTILSSLYQQYFHKMYLSLVHGEVHQWLLNAVINSLQPAAICTSTAHIPNSTTALIIVGNVIWQTICQHSGLVLVITENQNLDHLQEKLSQLWQTCRLADITVMAIGATIQFYTNFPYDEKNKCGEVIQPVLVEKIGIFPPKFQGNMHQCELSFLTDWIMPYVSRDGEGMTGIENEIFNEIVKRLNASAKPVILPENVNPQLTRDAKGNLMGGAQLLYERKLDLLFSAFTYRADLLGVVEFLTPHSMDSLAWFVPPPKPVSGATYLYLAFSNQIWLWVLVTLITIAVFLTVFHNIAIIEIVALTLNLSVSKHVPKLVMIFCYIYSLHITSCYQSSLFMLYSRNVMEKPIETIEQAADANLEGYFFNYHRPLINKTDHQLWKKIFKRHNFRDRQNPATFALKRDFLLLVQQYPVLYYSEVGHVYDEYGPAIMPLRDRFMMCPILFYTSRGNPLGQSFETIIQKLVEAGLVRKWLDNFVPNKVRRQKIAIDGLVTLSLFHLNGAFFILIGGIALAFLLLIIECLDNHLKSKKKEKTNHRRHVVTSRQMLFHSK